MKEDMTAQRKSTLFRRSVLTICPAVALTVVVTAAATPAESFGASTGRSGKVPSTVSGTFTGADPAASNGGALFTWEGTVTFSLVKKDGRAHYKVTEFTATWTAVKPRGSIECTATGSGSFGLADVNQPDAILYSYYTPGAPRPGEYLFWVTLKDSVDQRLPYVMTCPDSEGGSITTNEIYNIDNKPLLLVNTPAAGGNPISPNGKTFAGSYKPRKDLFDPDRTWNFRGTRPTKIP